MKYEFTLDIQTKSEMNERCHHLARWARLRDHRTVAWATLLNKTPELPVVVTMTRLSPGTLDSHDNLRSALKGVVDGIADALGVDDADPRVTWKYAQEKCERGTHQVRVEIERTE